MDATTNVPLEGATVSFKNSKSSILSTAGGTFEITAPTGKNVLEVSFVGYDTRTITIGTNETSLIIDLNQSSKELDNVVVIGYGTKKKVNLTGAISTVSAKEIESRPIANTQQALQGLVPNLNISVSNAGGGLGRL